MGFNFRQNIFVNIKSSRAYTKPVVVPKLAPIAGIFIAAQKNRIIFFMMQNFITTSGLHVYAKSFNALRVAMERGFGALN